MSKLFGMQIVQCTKIYKMSKVTQCNDNVVCYLYTYTVLHYIVICIIFIIIKIVENNIQLLIIENINTITENIITLYNIVYQYNDII